MMRPLGIKSRLEVHKERLRELHKLAVVSNDPAIQKEIEERKSLLLQKHEMGPYRQDPIISIELLRILEWAKGRVEKLELVYQFLDTEFRYIDGGANYLGVRSKDLNPIQPTKWANDWRSDLCKALLKRISDGGGGITKTELKERIQSLTWPMEGDDFSSSEELIKGLFKPTSH